MDANQKFAALCFGTAAALGVYAFKLFLAGKKIDKRLKRTQTFLSAMAGLDAKHAEADTLYSKEHSDELIALMDAHRM